MSDAKRTATLSLAALWATVSLGLLVTRGGVLALLGVAVGVALLVKALRRPGPADLRWAVAGVLVWGALWGVTLGAVYRGWESGEVVVIRPVDPSSGEASELRVWVVDDEVGGGPVVFYDGPPERLAAIGRQPSLEWERGGVTQRSRPTLHWLDEASPELVERVTGLFERKYGELDWAANLFYVLTGRASGRAVGIVKLGPLEP